MTDKTIARLVRATASEGDDQGLTRFVRRLMESFAASLPPGPALMFEEIVQSLAQAAEELPAEATPLQIRDRAREIRRNRH